MMTVALWAAIAWGQDTMVDFGCTPSPIEGTVQHAIVQQAAATNAQLYGAAGFAERVLFPRMAHQTAHDGTGLVWATEVFALAGAAYVPSIERGPGCDQGVQQHRVDLFSSATGLAFGIGKTHFYYAGSLTGHMYARRVTSGFVPYAYGLGTAMAGPLVTVPVTYMDIGDPQGTSSLAGDYFLGLHTDAKWLTASAAFVGSTGGFAHVMGKPVRFFAAAAVGADASLEYARAGLDRQPISKEVGASSAFVRQLDLATQSPGGSPIGTTFQTAHVEQFDIAGMLDLHFAYSVRPTPQVHDVRVGLHTPVYGVGKQILDQGEGFYDFEELTEDGGLMNVPASLTIGQVTLPALPQYGTPGGSAISIQAEAFMVFPSSDSGGLLIAYTFKANDPETLAAFPYATDALAHHFTIQLF